MWVNFDSDWLAMFQSYTTKSKEAEEPPPAEKTCLSQDEANKEIEVKEEVAEEVQNVIEEEFDWEELYRDLSNDEDDDHFYADEYDEYDFTEYRRPSKNNKQEKISSTHRHINSNVRARETEKKSVEEFYIERTKDNATKKTNYARYGQPFGPHNLKGLSQTQSRPRLVTRAQRQSQPLQTNFQDDAALKRAIQQSKSDIQQALRGHINRRQAELMAELQTRDLTPEDYELLLLLDESVAKKTIERSDIQKLPSRCFEPGSCGCQECIICMCEYSEGEEITKLPCGHEFHTSCVTTWLTMSSVNCPADNLPVEL